MITKPMLAVDAEDLTKLEYPVLASPKLDGIRCLKVNGCAVSRKFKPIPNNFIREWINVNLPDGVDGELLVGDNFQAVQHGVMSINGNPDFKYAIFDLVENIDDGYLRRFHGLEDWYAAQSDEVKSRSYIVPHTMCNSVEELQAFEEWCVANGYEGTMTRKLSGPYKNGRSTLKEGYLLKIKRWVDSEGVVTALEEQMSNQNEKTVDELGHSKRSSHQENMVPAGTLGKFIVTDVKTGQTVKVGSGLGLTKEFRQVIWDNPATYVGKKITYKWQPYGSISVKDGGLPRFPIFKGFRADDDMSE